MHNKYQYKEPQNGCEVNMQNGQNMKNNGQQNMKNSGENVASLNQNPYVNRQMGNMQQPQMQQTQQGFAQNQQQQNNQNPYTNNQNPYTNNQMNMQNSFANPYMNAQGLNQNPYFQTQNMQNPNTFTSKVAQNVNHIFDNKFLLGVVVGGVATYLLTNEKAQKAIIKSGMKLYSAVAGGVEELKEKVMDAKAELQEKKAEDGTN